MTKMLAWTRGGPQARAAVAQALDPMMADITIVDMETIHVHGTVSVAQLRLLVRALEALAEDETPQG